jgi:hypothetical protein
MKQAYEVHSCSMSTLPYRVVHDGKAINATVNCLEVELTDPDHRSGTITLRLIGDDVSPAEALFKDNAKISVTFEAA